MGNHLSDSDRQGLKIGGKRKTELYQPPRKIRFGALKPVETRKKDRRVAINSYVDPAMERRSGHDRRRG